MTHDEFITEYYSVSARALELSEKARKKGLLVLEEMIDRKKMMQRDILEYGLRFVVDGTDAVVIRDLLSLIIEQEEDKYTRKLMEMKEYGIPLRKNLAVTGGPVPAAPSGCQG